jgi:hypothetical protein
MVQRSRSSSLQKKRSTRLSSFLVLALFGPANGKPLRKEAESGATGCIREVVFLIQWPSRFDGRMSQTRQVISK